MPDEMRPMLPRDLLIFATNSISTFFSLFVPEFRFLRDLKSTTSPKFGMGARHKPENYRPSALTGVVVKVLQNIILKSDMASEQVSHISQIYY